MNTLATATNDQRINWSIIWLIGRSGFKYNGFRRNANLIYD